MTATHGQGPRAAPGGGARGARNQPAAPTSGPASAPTRPLALLAGLPHGEVLALVPHDGH